MKFTTIRSRKRKYLYTHIYKTPTLHTYANR